MILWKRSSRSCHSFLYEKKLKSIFVVNLYVILPFHLPVIWKDDDTDNIDLWYSAIIILKKIKWSHLWLNFERFENLFLVLLTLVSFCFFQWLSTFYHLKMHFHRQLLLLYLLLLLVLLLFFSLDGQSFVTLLFFIVLFFDRDVLHLEVAALQTQWLSNFVDKSHVP